ncbi:MAG: hypothetical protein FH753_01885 [Firmicutes bacterium]|nr:hypothetical protein [Bacillota bacterium]
MRRFRKNYLEQFYTIDRDTGKIIIEISIEDYNDIFNSWDSSVYNVRDLDSSLKTFLQDCSYDIDLYHDIILRFNLYEEDRDPKVEETITKGIRNYFRYYFHVTKNRVSAKRKKSLLHILISVMFITVSYILKDTLHQDIFNNVLLQGLAVGGWVFLWEAFSVLFIQNSDMVKTKKEYKRLLNAPMEFRYL